MRDTLIKAGVARSRSEVLARCARLVGQHQSELVWACVLSLSRGSVQSQRALFVDNPCL